MYLYKLTTVLVQIGKFICPNHFGVGVIPDMQQGRWCTPIWWRSKLTTFEAFSNKLVQSLNSGLQVAVRNKSETLTQTANFPI